MAASSSDESSTAPKDFHLSSSIDSGSRLSPVLHRCQLCGDFRRRFYCRECVQNGDFVSSSAHCLERFADKQLRLLRLKASRRVLEERCCEHLARKQRADDAVRKVRECGERVRLLRLLLEGARDRQAVNGARLKFLLHEVQASNNRLTQYEDRVGKLERYVAHKADKVADSGAQLAQQRDRLKRVARARVHQLLRYIFPIAQLQPCRPDVESSGELATVSALAEATHTTYVRGRWVFSDSWGELQHSIVAPTLPGSGDYAAYHLWVAENRDGVAAAAGPAPCAGSTAAANPAHSITAALTYAAQLLHVLAFFLDVRLPYKLSYGDFCGADMSEQVFARRVARLNADVLHVCFSQSVRPAALHPARTLHNVLQLLDARAADLGRVGPVETEPDLARSLESQLARDLRASEDSDSDSADTLPYEWEAVPHVQCPEAPAGAAALQSQQIAAAQTTSIAGGLVTSAAASLASFWRGWTGK